MTHGATMPCTALYGPWVLGLRHTVCPMTHGEKVAERCACNNSQNLPTTPLVLLPTHLCSPSMIIPTPLLQDAVPSPVRILLIMFLAVLVSLLAILMLAAWWLGLRHLMTLGAPQMLSTGMLHRMTDSGCCPVQESEQGRHEQEEGDLGVPKSLGIFSTWGNWIGQRTINLCQDHSTQLVP